MAIPAMSHLGVQIRISHRIFILKLRIQLHRTLPRPLNSLRHHRHILNHNLLFLQASLPYNDMIAIMVTGWALQLEVWRQELWARKRIVTISKIRGANKNQQSLQ